VGWERRRRRNRGWECRQVGAYNGFFRRTHWQIHSVGDIATSLYGYHSLNPSVLSVGKIAWRHHAVAYFQTKCIFRRWSRRYIPTEIFYRYIPTALPTEWFRRYIPTDFKTELCPSVLITDGIFPSVIPLLFSGFLVVTLLSSLFFLPSKNPKTHRLNIFKGLDLEYTIFFLFKYLSNTLWLLNLSLFYVFMMNFIGFPHNSSPSFFYFHGRH